MRRNKDIARPKLDGADECLDDSDKFITSDCGEDRKHTVYKERIT